MDHVAAAQLERIDPEAVPRAVHHLLAGNRLEHPRAPVRPTPLGVRVDRLRGSAQRGDPVRTGEHHRGEDHRARPSPPGTPPRSRGTRPSPRAQPVLVGGEGHGRHGPRGSDRRTSGSRADPGSISRVPRSSRLTSPTASSSRQGFIFSPKDPPTSGMTTRTWLSSMPSARAKKLRTPCGPWVEIQTVSSPGRVPARQDAPGLHRHRRVPVLAKRLGQHHRSRRHHRIELGLLGSRNAALEVRTFFRVHDRRLRIERALHVEHRGRASMSISIASTASSAM